VEVNATKYNATSIINEILLPIVKDIVSDAIRCENIPEASSGGRRLIREAQKVESEISSSIHQNSERRKILQQRHLSRAENSCTPYESKVQLDNTLIFDFFEELSTKIALISTHILITCLDGSNLSEGEGEGVRYKVESALNKATVNGVLKDLFYV